MKIHHTLSLAAFSAFSMVAFGCAQPTENVDDTQVDDETPSATPNRFMHITNPEALAAAVPANAHLTYYGGPVIPNVNIVPVFWNSTVLNQASLNGFYKGVTNSILFDWLSEYNTASPAQSIARGTAVNGFVNNNITTSTTDAKIQAELNKLFTAGSLPAPNGNNLYMVHFPKNMKITASDGSRACVQWCAYHGTYVRNGVNVYYGVLPDVSSTGCAGGCGGSTAFNNETSVASHEMIEAVTDAAVGLATTYAPPLAWYDANNGEIGDICNGLQGSVLGGNGTTYTVQKEWSNAKGACITNY